MDREIWDHSQWGHLESDTTGQLTLSLLRESTGYLKYSAIVHSSYWNLFLGMSITMPEVRGSSGGQEEHPISKDLWLRGCRRAKRSYSTFKVKRGGGEEIPLVQGKEQWLRFAGAAVKRYPMPKVRETQVRW